MKFKHSKSGANARAVTLAIQKRISGVISSDKKGGKLFGWSAQWFGKKRIKYMEEQAAAVQIAAADTEISTPKSVSSRAYIEELKAVSAAVVKERKKKKGRSTKAMIQAMNAHLMVPNSVNCHITRD